MHCRLLNPEAGARVLAVVLEPDEEVVESLLRAAREQQVGASQLVGIGALRDAVLGFWDPERQDYQRIPITEQVEVLSLAGNLAEGPDGQPFLHAHLVVGKRDGSAHGGHLLEAHVYPTLEVLVTESPGALRRERDAATGLTLLAR